MGRKGITYEQVAAVADAMDAEREGSVTLMALRQRLGTGSASTIHKHWQVWIANKPKVAAPLISIPDDVARAMTGWVLQASTSGRAEAEERAVNAQAAADELAKAGEELENERDQLQAEIASLTTQRDQQQAMADERSAEIRRLLADVERERSLAGAAQVEAAQARLRADSQVEHLADTRAQVETLSAAIEVERAARTAAEKDGAVIAAQLAGARADLDAVRTQVAALQQELARLREQQREEINALHGAVDSARDALIAETGVKFKLEAELTTERERVKTALERSKEAMTAEHSRMVMLEEQNTDLRERLKAAEAQGKAATGAKSPGNPQA